MEYGNVMLVVWRQFCFEIFWIIDEVPIGVENAEYYLFLKIFRFIPQFYVLAYYFIFGSIKFCLTLYPPAFLCCCFQRAWCFVYLQWLVMQVSDEVCFVAEALWQRPWSHGCNTLSSFWSHTCGCYFLQRFGGQLCKHSKAGSWAPIAKELWLSSDASSLCTGICFMLCSFYQVFC